MKRLSMLLLLVCASNVFGAASSSSAAASSSSAAASLSSAVDSNVLGSSSSASSDRAVYVTIEQIDALNEEFSHAFKEMLDECQSEAAKALMENKEEHEKNGEDELACRGYLWSAFCLANDEEKRDAMLSKACEIYAFKLDTDFADYQKCLMAISALGYKKALDQLFAFYWEHEKAEVVCHISDSQHAFKALAEKFYAALDLGYGPNRFLDERLLAKYEYYASKAKDYYGLGCCYECLASRGGPEGVRWEKLAIANFRKAVAAGNHWAPDRYALFLKHRQIHGEMVEVLKKGVELGNYESALSLADFYRESDIELAITYAHDALKLRDSAFCKKHLANLYLEAGNLDMAEKYFVEAANEDSSYWLELGNFFRDARHLYSKAEGCYRSFLQENYRDSRRRDVFLLLGKLYEFQLGNLAEAEKAYSEGALRGMPSAMKGLCNFWCRVQGPLDALGQKIIRFVAEEKISFARVLLLSRMHPDLFDDRKHEVTQSYYELMERALKSEESSEVILFIIKSHSVSYEGILRFLDHYDLSDEFKQEALAQARAYYASRESDS